MAEQLVMMTSAGDPSVNRWTISLDIFLCWHTAAASLTCSASPPCQKLCKYRLWVCVICSTCAHWIFRDHIVKQAKLTLMLSGNPSSVSMSSTYSVRTSAHISYRGRTRHVFLLPSLTSLEGSHEIAAISGETRDASRIFSCLAATAADLASTSCLALDHGPKVLACQAKMSRSAC